MLFRKRFTTSNQPVFCNAPRAKRWHSAHVVAGLVLVLLSLSINSAHAANRYWVSLGSFSNAEGAESVLARASDTFSQLSIVPSETPVGLVYRVMNGPSTDRNAANEQLDQARMAGFVDAWLLSKDSSEGLPAAVVNGDSYGSSSSADSYESSSYESNSYESSSYDSSRYGLEDSASGQLLQDYSGGETVSDPSSADYDAVLIGKQELVEEAPAGYGLHQLQRVDGQMESGEPVESRLQELNDLETDAQEAVDNPK